MIFIQLAEKLFSRQRFRKKIILDIEKIDGKHRTIPSLTIPFSGQSSECIKIEFMSVS